MPSEIPTYDPTSTIKTTLQPTMNSFNMPTHVTTTPYSETPSFLRKGRTARRNQLSTSQPTMNPSAMPTHQPSLSPETSFIVTFEVPENELFNVTKTKALESAVANALLDPACKFEYFHFSSVELLHQSLSAGSDFLIVDLNIKGVLDTEDNESATQYNISECIRVRRKEIKHDYNKSMGYLNNEKGPTVSGVDNGGSLFERPPILISVGVVAFLACIVLFAYSMYFVRKRKLRRKEILDDLHQMYDDREFEEDDDSFSYASEHNEDIHNELGSIKQILNMVLNGSDNNGPAINQEDLSQMSYSTSEVRSSIKLSCLNI